MPALHTWKGYVPKKELFFNSTTVIYRNRHYPPGGLNTSNWQNTAMGMAEMTVFQADYYGSQIQFYRRGSGIPERTLGSQYWQLDDQWAAPTWAGIDRAGRWKIPHCRARDLAAFSEENLIGKCQIRIRAFGDSETRLCWRNSGQ
ncbi:beta-mannosidase [Apiospora saccharicola]|uniref:Beta-mannosidase n=1 Tax=Apiospora saccharicola TaxID=335842 RepID=A0ABR1W773_9PEZI